MVEILLKGTKTTCPYTAEFITSCTGACFATGIGAQGLQLKTLKTMRVFQAIFGSGSYVLLSGKGKREALKLTPFAKHLIHDV